MNDMLPSYQLWIVSALFCGIAGLIAIVPRIADVHADTDNVQVDRAADVMVSAPPAPETVAIELVERNDPPAAELSHDVSAAPIVPQIGAGDLQLAPRELEAPDRAVPVVSPASTPQQEPTAPHEHVDTVALERELPAAQAAEYEKLRDEGIALRQSSVDGHLPAYEANIPSEMIDSWLRRGLARLIVVAQHDRNVANGIYTFHGTLADPGNHRLIGSVSEIRGFSSRYIAMSPAQGHMLLRHVPRADSGTMRFTPGVLVRADLDAVVLAVQQRVAREMDLPLEEIAITYGRFRIVNGLPFTYEIDRIRTIDGQVLTVRRPAASITAG